MLTRWLLGLDHGRRFLFNIGETIDRGAEGARSNAEGVRIEAPRGWGVGRFPLPLGEGSGEWAVPPRQKIFRLRISKW